MQNQPIQKAEMPINKRLEKIVNVYILEKLKDAVEMIENREESLVYKSGFLYSKIKELSLYLNDLDEMSLKLIHSN